MEVSCKTVPWLTLSCHCGTLVGRIAATNKTREGSLNKRGFADFTNAAAAQITSPLETSILSFFGLDREEVGNVKSPGSVQSELKGLRLVPEAKTKRKEHPDKSVEAPINPL